MHGTWLVSNTLLKYFHFFIRAFLKQIPFNIDDNNNNTLDIENENNIHIDSDVFCKEIGFY